jgi:hypothetical protein
VKHILQTHRALFAAARFSTDRADPSVVDCFPSVFHRLQIFMLYGVKEFEPNTWTNVSYNHTPGADEAGVGFNRGLLLSWILWLYSGFFSMGPPLAFWP